MIVILFTSSLPHLSVGVAVAGEVTDHRVPGVAVTRAAHLAARAAVGLQHRHRRHNRGGAEGGCGRRGGGERAREGERVRLRGRWRVGRTLEGVSTCSIRRRGAEVGLRHVRARRAGENEWGKEHLRSRASWRLSWRLVPEPDDNTLARKERDNDHLQRCVTLPNTRARTHTDEAPHHTPTTHAPGSRCPGPGPGRGWAPGWGQGWGRGTGRGSGPGLLGRWAGCRSSTRTCSPTCGRTSTRPPWAWSCSPGRPRRRQRRSRRGGRWCVG